MEDLLVSQEVAYLAHEKGFDWDWDGIHYYLPNNVTIPRVTQSLLSRWLREIHDIHIEIPFSLLTGFHAHIYYLEESKLIQGQELLMIGGYETYQEALEQGLTQALNQLP